MMVEKISAIMSHKQGIAPKAQSFPYHLPVRKRGGPYKLFYYKFSSGCCHLISNRQFLIIDFVLYGSRASNQ
jgi:hypothetical protein